MLRKVIESALTVRTAEGKTRKDGAVGGTEL